MEEMRIQIAGIERHSSVNGPGVRYVLFTQGCPHACPGCQNPDTWSPTAGVSYDTEDIINDILSTKYIDGVTLSGGDPLFQAKPILEIVKALNEKKINIWCYTGWTYEQLDSLQAGPEAKEVLSYLDVLVDGRFVLSLLSRDCIYRGSTNQRLIDCKKSIQEGKVVEMTSFNYGL
jgi:anaerobic ribonucleoside-triphosphate reductase activating protein